MRCVAHGYQHVAIPHTTLTPCCSAGLAHCGTVVGANMPRHRERVQAAAAAAASRPDAEPHPKAAIPAVQPAPSASASSGAVVAAIVGASAALALTAAIILYVLLQRRRQRHEEMPFIKSAHGEVDAEGSCGPSDVETDEAIAAVERARDPTSAPDPLPAPSILNKLDTPPPLPHYSRLELRQLEGDGDTAHCWAGLPTSQFAVRGPGYLRDGEKVPSEPFSQCLAVELFRAERSPRYHVARRADAPTPTLAQRTTAPISSTFVVNLIIPAGADGFFQVVFYFGILREAPTPTGKASAAARLYERFRAGTDAFRKKRLKLIPSVAEGPWLVKTGVGSRPSILGKTLKQKYYVGADYLEVDVDCNSSPAAGRIVSLVKSYARSLVIDLAFVIEGATTDELPERVAGCARLMHIDLGEEGGVPEDHVAGGAPAWAPPSGAPAWPGSDADAAAARQHAVGEAQV